MSLPTLDRVLDAIFRVDMDLQIKFISEQGLRWLGISHAAATPTSLLALLHPQDADKITQPLRANAPTLVCDVRLLRGGRAHWVNIRGYHLQGADQYALCVLDISAWKTHSTDFQHAAEHDELTDLPNRAYLKRAIDQKVQGGAGPFSVVLLDLDGFKKVNDSFGHAMGDAVLVETAQRLRRLVGPQDLVARLGGDEFVLLLEGKEAPAAKEALTTVLHAIARPYDTTPHSSYLGASVGIAQHPLHGDDYSVLLKNADAAMYRSKNAGKNRITVFTPSEDSGDFPILTAMHQGIQEGEFYMVYQPQFDMAGHVVGAEALMRWNSREFGEVPPDRFIPIAEDSGLMPFLGRWALGYACHQLHQFQALLPAFVMSVNVSPVQFGAEDFDVQVLETLSQAGVEPGTVILEITESTLMQSQEHTERALSTLRDHQVRFSIDDFGTGFSSLAYLTRLPVSSIKIDKAFIRALEHPRATTESDRNLVRAMINLAHSIDLKVVAEGVETQVQFDFLQHSGCELIQGYLMGKPMSAQALSAVIETHTRAVA